MQLKTPCGTIASFASLRYGGSAGTTGYWKARPNAIGREQSIALSQRRCNVRGDAFYEPPAGAGAETSFGRGGLPGVGPTEVHVQLRLLIGDVSAGHSGDLFWGVESPAISARLTESQAGPPRGNRADAGPSLRSGYAQPTAGLGVIHPDRRAIHRCRSPNAVTEANTARATTSRSAGRVLGERDRADAAGQPGTAADHRAGRDAAPPRRVLRCSAPHAGAPDPPVAGAIGNRRISAIAIMVRR